MYDVYQDKTGPKKVLLCLNSAHSLKQVQRCTCSCLLSEFWSILLVCSDSHSQVHIIYGVWITVCSLGPLLLEGSNLDWSRPILQRRVWPAFTVCCCGNSHTCGELRSCTTLCTMQPTWASANSSAISPALSRTLLYAGSTASVPNGDKQIPQNQVRKWRVGSVFCKTEFLCGFMCQEQPSFISI